MFHFVTGLTLYFFFFFFSPLLHCRPPSRTASPVYRLSALIHFCSTLTKRHRSSRRRLRSADRVQARREWESKSFGNERQTQADSKNMNKKCNRFKKQQHTLNFPVQDFSSDWIPIGSDALHFEFMQPRHPKATWSQKKPRKKSKSLNWFQICIPFHKTNRSCFWFHSWFGLIANRKLNFCSYKTSKFEKNSIRNVFECAHQKCSEWI